jgi:hypothetical protein
VSSDNTITNNGANLASTPASVTTVSQLTSVKNTASAQQATPTSVVAPTQATTSPAAITSGNLVASPVVTVVSLNNAASANSAPVGTQTIAPIETPKSAEDLRDPVLAALGNFKPTSLTTAAAKSNVSKGKDVPVVVPIVQGILSIETVPPRSASQAVDEQRLSASGNRSRW